MERRRGLLFFFAMIQGIGLALLAWVVSIAEARDGGLQNRMLFQQDMQVREMIGHLSCQVAEQNNGEACRLKLITDAAPAGIALPVNSQLQAKFYAGETQVRITARFAGSKLFSIAKVESVP